MTLCVTKEDAQRPEQHADAERRTIVVVVEVIVPHALVGMQCVTLCVTKEDAQRPEQHADAERRTIVVVVEVIVPHAPAWECSA
ncbi:hypothetical protein [Pseudomonas syringae group genomosp. 3]|uniref:hypothetical protein n=1 Tax=Pseudomonas syringae group genomosp. 3 TaxID=251701 RepID=UPI0025546AA9|nr:hypothetical protein [Pseudomonas syringae group genomosp. 3]WIN07687.1 hypothetical protein QQF68_02015 [Pseudomonas syringae pv. antirrhini str. 126]